ncbi:MAG: hypothetical protein Q8Q24_01040 [bacterium]|nr:hypothetical protein [bacterium]
MNLSFLKKRKLLLLVLFLSLIGLLLRLLFLYKYSNAFTYDQGRDLLDIRAMIVLNKLTLIGPTTSLHGVFSGPFWYWMALPFYLLTNGSPLSTELLMLTLSLIIPILFFVLISDKKLGLILSSIYIFAYSFFGTSMTALNTNPMIYSIPLFLILSAKFFTTSKLKYLFWAFFVMSSTFHFEAIIGVFLIPVFFIAVLIFKKIKLLISKSIGMIGLLLPLLPQIFFDFRHDFIQSRAIFSLVTGKGDSLTPAEGDIIFRFQDRLRIFEDVFKNASMNPFLMIIFIISGIFLLKKLTEIRKSRKEETYFLQMVFVSLIVIFTGFVVYPYALWPWYLHSIDALYLTLIGFSIYFVSTKGRKLALISSVLLLIFLLFNIKRYDVFPVQPVFTADAANLRTRIMVVDSIYESSKGQGFRIFTFAPYVYDYPYQYLIWWRAKTKYNYLPEEYTYLSNQPPYVAAKIEADKIILSRKSTCTYLISEPFESQKQWFIDWRGRFPDAQESWQIGKTKIEKLCQLK